MEKRGNNSLLSIALTSRKGQAVFGLIAIIVLLAGVFVLSNSNNLITGAVVIHIKDTTTISACTNLSATNETYQLNQNITSAGDCFNIRANNTVLDCQGFALTSSSGGVGINSSYTLNTTIKNCKINSYLYGIFSTTANSSFINGNSISTPATHLTTGVYFTSAYFNNASFNTIITSPGNGQTGYGIQILNSNKNIFSNNTINITNGNSGRAFLASNANENNFTSNNVIVSASNEVLRLTSSSNNTVASNKISVTTLSVEGTIGYGIFFSNAINNNISANSFNTTGGPAIYVTGSSIQHFNQTIDYQNTENNKPIMYLFNQYNTNFTNNASLGLLYFAHADNITVDNVTIADGDGIYFAMANRSVVQNSNITRATGFGVGFYLSRNSSITNNIINTSASNGYGAYIDSDINNISVSSNNISTLLGYGIYLHGGGVGLNSQYTTVSWNNISVVGTHAIAIDCPGCGGPENNTINSNSIISYAGGQYGISSAGANNTISSNNITMASAGSGAVGIAISSTNHNIVTGNRITNIGSSAYGIYVAGSSTSNTTVSSNSVTMTGSNSWGVYSSGALNNSYVSNTITVGGAGSDGIGVSNSNQETIIGNIVSTSGSINNQGANGWGVYLTNSGNNNLSYNNITSGNATSLFVSGTTITHYNNSIDGTNTADGKPINYYFNQNNFAVSNNASWGLLYITHSNNFTANNITINSADGIWVSSSNNTVITNSNITNASAQGIDIYGGYNNLINNTVINTTSWYGHGVYIEGSATNAIVRDSTILTIRDNAYGIYALSAQAPNITNVTLTTYGISGAYGITFSSAPNGTIQSSTLSANSSSTIYINTASNFANIISNTISNNRSLATGIYADSSTDALILNNNITAVSTALYFYPYNHRSVIIGNLINSTTSTGIDIEYSDNGTIQSNNIYTSSLGTRGINLGVVSRANITNNSIIQGVNSNSVSLSAIYLSSVTLSNITNNNISTNGTPAVYILTSNNNNFARNTFRSAGPQSIYDGYIESSKNSTFIDDYFVPPYGILLKFAEQNNKFTNVTHNKTNVIVFNGTDNSSVSVRWWASVQVKDKYGESLTNSNITVYNNSINPLYSQIESTGNTTLIELVEYVRTNNTNNYTSIHYINASKTNYFNNATTINLSQTNSTIVTLFMTSIGPTRCDNITASQTFFQNVSGTGDCLSILADNIVVDGAGFAVLGNGSGYGVKNAGNFSNITIKNFKGIYNFGIGVYGYGMANSSILNNTIISLNTTDFAGQGIALTTASNFNNVLFNNIAGAGDSGNSIFINFSSTANNISFNTLNSYGIRTAGIVINSSAANSIFSNFINISTGDGIHIYSSPNTVISNNNISVFGNAADGIELQKSNLTLIQYNNITAYSTGARGVLFLQAYNNTLNFNNITANGSSTSTIRFDENSSYNTLTANNIFSNGQNSQGALFINLFNYGNANLTANNFIVNNLAQVFRLFSGQNITVTNNNLTAQGNISLIDGNIIFTNTTLNRNGITFETGTSTGSVVIQWYFNASVQNNTGSPIANANITLFNLSALPEINKLTNSIGQLPNQILTEFFQNRTNKTYFTPHNINVTLDGYNSRSAIINLTQTNSTSSSFTTNISSLECGSITKSGNLTNNISVNGNCFTINSDNIILDGLGNTLRSTGTGIGFNVTGRKNITIKNFNIANLTYGIVFAQTNDSISSGISTTGAGIGLLLSNARNITINNSLTNTTSNTFFSVNGTSATILLINKTINSSNILFDDLGTGAVLVQWYVNISVIDSSTSSDLSNANATIYNNSGIAVFSNIINSSTPTIVLTEVIYERNITTYSTPHTLTIRATNYDTTTFTLNLTKNQSFGFIAKVPATQAPSATPSANDGTVGKISPAITAPKNKDKNSTNTTDENSSIQSPESQTPASETQRESQPEYAFDEPPLDANANNQENSAFEITPDLQEELANEILQLDEENITEENTTLEPVCGQITERLSDKIKIGRGEIGNDINIPEGYEIAGKPIKFTCNGDTFSFTLDTADNFKDLKVLRCSDESCQKEQTVETDVTTQLACGNKTEEELNREEISRETTISPAENFDSILSNSAIVSETFKELSSGKNKVSFTKTITQPFEVSIGGPNNDIPLFTNPLIDIIGTPFRITAQSMPDSTPVDLTVSFIQKEDYDVKTLSLYALKNGIWEELGGTANLQEQTITLSISDLKDFIDQNGNSLFAVTAIQCKDCHTSKFQKVYASPKSRKALILVHGLFSAPDRFNNLINEFRLTKQPWQVWTFAYPSSQDFGMTSQQLADALERHQQEYDEVTIIGHSLGGLISQEALHRAEVAKKISSDQYLFLPKVKRVIIAGSPNLGSPAIEIYKRLQNFILSSNSSIGTPFITNSSIVQLLTKGIQIPRVKNIEYIGVAGTKPYPFNEYFFTNPTLIPNDGIVGVPSVQNIGGIPVTNACVNYYELNLTHNDLNKHPFAVRVLSRIVNAPLAEKHDLISFAGYNQYLKINVDKCSSNDEYVVIGKRIREEKVIDPVCSCGNGWCGEGETPESCPKDCANIATPENACLVLPFTSIFTMLIIFMILSYAVFILSAKKTASKKLKVALIVLWSITIIQLAYQLRICKDLTRTNIVIFTALTSLIILVLFYQRKKNIEEELHHIIIKNVERGFQLHDIVNALLEKKWPQELVFRIVANLKLNNARKLLKHYEKKLYDHHHIKMLLKEKGFSEQEITLIMEEHKL